VSHPGILRLLVAYDGTAFSGYQVQPGERTVQGVLTDALATLASRPVRLRAAGRTDAGVHALGQVVSVDEADSVHPDVVMRAMPSLLPADAPAPLSRFHAPDGGLPQQNSQHPQVRVVGAPQPDMSQRRQPARIRGNDLQPFQELRHLIGGPDHKICGGPAPVHLRSTVDDALILPVTDHMRDREVRAGRQGTDEATYPCHRLVLVWNEVLNTHDQQDGPGDDDEEVLAVVILPLALDLPVVADDAVALLAAEGRIRKNHVIALAAGQARGRQPAYERPPLRGGQNDPGARKSSS
jgi:hypothetical protein